MERDKAHLDEALKLPFGLPGLDDFATQPSEKKRAEKIVRDVAAKFRKLHSEITKSARQLIARSDELPLGDSSRRKITPDERKNWSAKWREKTAALQTEIEPLIYEYYGFIAQERILIEDTCDIFAKSATPGSINTPIPTLEVLQNAKELKDYADTLAQTLQGWSTNEALKLKLTAGINETLALGILRVEPVKSPSSFHTAPLTDELAEAVKRIEKAASTTNGTLDYLQDETRWLEGAAINIAKPALRGRWTRTAALNDAAEIYATIQHPRPRKA